jgi:hypothetical protein
MNRTLTWTGRAQNIGKIHGEPNLDADSWACYIFASEQPEIKSHAAAKRALSPYESLELASAETPVTGKSPVKLTAERQPGRDVVQDRESAGINMPARSLNPQYACAGVASEQEADVPIYLSRTNWSDDHVACYPNTRHEKPHRQCNRVQGEVPRVPR